MKVDLSVQTEVSTSIRARQVQASFDVPERKQEQLRWQLEMPIEARAWGVGLIVGPSGSGKSSVMRHVFGAERPLTWAAKSVIDDFAQGLTVERITEACGAVGFNTIPAWLRPYHVLSNGEKFRVELARRLLEHESPIVIDEFTSLVDRQVAKVASHAAQKYARRVGKQLVAVTCHYDVEDWLQPDWVLDVSTRAFTWRSLQRRPTIDVELRRVHRDVWPVFAPFHYLTSELHTAAKLFAAHVGGKPVSLVAVLHQPHPNVKQKIWRVSRLVTLPDWQGLGIAAQLVDRVASAFKALGFRFRRNPSHRALVRSVMKSPLWRLDKPLGTFSQMTNRAEREEFGFQFGGRPSAAFEYIGPAWVCRLEASALILGDAS